MRKLISSIMIAGGIAGIVYSGYRIHQSYGRIKAVTKSNTTETTEQSTTEPSHTSREAEPTVVEPVTDTPAVNEPTAELHDSLRASDTRLQDAKELSVLFETMFETQPCIVEALDTSRLQSLAVGEMASYETASNRRGINVGTRYGDVLVQEYGIPGSATYALRVEAPVEIKVFCGLQTLPNERWFYYLCDTAEKLKLMLGTEAGGDNIGYKTAI